MRTFMLFVLCLPLVAQTASHSVTLNWLYTVYRSPGLCSGSPTFAKVAAAITAKTYLDTTVAPGNYCYQVTATAGSVESAPSNTALAPVPSFAPQNLTVTVR